MGDGGESGDGRTTHGLGGRFVAEEMGVGSFEIGKFPNEVVVVGVADFGRIVAVVSLIVMRYQFTEFGDTPCFGGALHGFLLLRRHGFHRTNRVEH